MVLTARGASVAQQPDHSLTGVQQVEVERDEWATLKLLMREAKTSREDRLPEPVLEAIFSGRPPAACRD